MKRTGFKKTEIFFFLIFSIVSILPFFLVRYIPSLDGPQHLYTSRLIAELIKGDDFIAQYYRFNPMIVGNMSSLYLMAILMFVFPAWLAEKIFLSIYIIGLALAFRYFIRSIQKTDSLLYLLIFPFAFSSLFMLGYYNFCVAFIPLFIALGYFKRHETRLGIRETLWLALMSSLIYITHAIVFVFFGMILFLQMIFDLTYPIIIKTFSFKILISVIKKYLIILSTAIPSIVLWVIYYLSLNTGNENSPSVSFRPVSDILGELYKLRILIGFHHGQEAGPNTLMFWSLVALILLAIIPLYRIFPRLIKPAKSNDADWLKWTFIVLTLFILTLFLPDRMVTGSMSARFSILFFLIVIAWISLQSFPKIIIFFGLFLVLGAHTWHRNIIYQFHDKINKQVADLEETAKFIKPNTILFPINCSESWFQNHFHCYLGVDKPNVNLRNPQVGGPMPLVWNYTKMPNMLLGELDQNQAGVYWTYGNKYLTPVKINYIFIWRPQRMEQVEGTTMLLDKVNPYYTQVFKSKSGNALLLQLKNNN